jgi:hypothetical protein
MLLVAPDTAARHDGEVAVAGRVTTAERERTRQIDPHQIAPRIDRRRPTNAARRSFSSGNGVALCAAS